MLHIDKIKKKEEENELTSNKEKIRKKKHRGSLTIKALTADDERKDTRRFFWTTMPFHKDPVKIMS